MRPLADLFVLLETAPWSGEPYDSKNPRANMLTHPFGERGLATYVVLERQGEVYVVRIEWPQVRVRRVPVVTAIGGESRLLTVTRLASCPGQRFLCSGAMILRGFPS